MSYDYMLTKWDGEGLPDLDQLAAAGVDTPLGTLAEVQSALAALFPSLQWTHRNNSVAKGSGVPRPLEGEIGFVSGSSDESDFSLLLEDDLVRSLSMSRVEREHVQVVASKLGLVAVDEQTEEIFGS